MNMGCTAWWLLVLDVPEGWQRFVRNPAISFLEIDLNAFHLHISGSCTADSIIRWKGGQKPILWGTGKIRRLWASFVRFRHCAESKVIGRVRLIIRRDWKQLQIARFAEFSGAKWPILTRIVAIGLPGAIACLAGCVSLKYA